MNQEVKKVIIASPSYWGDVPGQLKVFFDRCTPLCNTGEGGTSVPKGKVGISIAVRAGTRQEENMHLIDSEHYFGHLEVKPIEMRKGTAKSFLYIFVRNSELGHIKRRRT